MIRQCFFSALLLSSFYSHGFQESTTEQPGQYVREDLFVFLHAGPGRNYRILGSIDAGTAITVGPRGSESDFTQVTDDQGREGWIESRFVSNEAPSTLRIPALESALEASQSDAATLAAENTELRQRVNQAEEQLASVNEQLQRQNSEVASLTASLDKADQDEQMRWFTRGGMVAGAGVLLGILLMLVPKKRRRNSEWM